ncbi:hypothetical protein ACH4E8_26830 [Streptomyces sp. NPDC017979]|uniref:hypothetical protein n=1 Tax=Streptomyces sp. NPDC017979 TaxID=3365024 RepID=UPI0037936397
MLDPELLERITTCRADLDELEEHLAKQLVERVGLGGEAGSVPFHGADEAVHDLVVEGVHVAAAQGRVEVVLQQRLDLPARCVAIPDRVGVGAARPSGLGVFAVLEEAAHAVWAPPRQ